jgi:hypothetical protein
VASTTDLRPISGFFFQGPSGLFGNDLSDWIPAIQGGKDFAVDFSRSRRQSRAFRSLPISTPLERVRDPACRKRRPLRLLFQALRVSETSLAATATQRRRLNLTQAGSASRLRRNLSKESSDIGERR